MSDDVIVRAALTEALEVWEGMLAQARERGASAYEVGLHEHRVAVLRGVFEARV